MASEAGKGDKQRPTDHAVYAANFDRIFKKPQTNEGVLTEQGRMVDGLVEMTQTQQKSNPQQLNG